MDGSSLRKTCSTRNHTSEAHTHSVLIDNINDGDELALVAATRDSRDSSSFDELGETLRERR